MRTLATPASLCWAQATWQPWTGALCRRACSSTSSESGRPAVWRGLQLRCRFAAYGARCLPVERPQWPHGPSLPPMLFVVALCCRADPFLSELYRRCGLWTMCPEVRVHNEVGAGPAVPGGTHVAQQGSAHTACWMPATACYTAFLTVALAAPHPPLTYMYTARRPGAPRRHRLRAPTVRAGICPQAARHGGPGRVGPGAAGVGPQPRPRRARGHQR